MKKALQKIYEKLAYHSFDNSSLKSVANSSQTISKLTYAVVFLKERNLIT